MNIDNLYPCRCCGYKTLNAQPPGTYLICPICFWEDDWDDVDGYYNYSNNVSLRQAQRNFIDFGACDREWLNDVRSPITDDIRDSDWQTIDALAEQTRLNLIEQIAIAFKDVTLEDGISIHEARAIDDYGDRKFARQIDGKVPWQEIPDAWIEKFYDVFSFMDAKGFRHAIPAYMIWTLNNYKTSDSNSSDFIVYALERSQRDGYYKSHFELLNLEQQQIVLDFLKLMDFLNSI